MDELVLTFLSQNTSDLNSGRAFETLKARYPAWQAVLDAPLAELAETIRSGGLAQQKAPRIQAAFRRIQAERGEFNLDFLADLPVDEATRWLTSFDGIGHKTSRSCCSLLNKPAFPVDTHVGRVPAGWAWPGRRIPRKRSRRFGRALALADAVLPAASESDPARAGSMPCTEAGVHSMRAPVISCKYPH